MTARALRFAMPAGLLLSGVAIAGPPYQTDDPVPTDRGHWEIYHFVQAAHVPGETTGEAGLDLNYGGAEDVQLTLVLPLAFDRTDRSIAGRGVVETAVKMRLARQDEEGWRPDVAFFPRILWPTADSRFGTAHVNVLLPLWLGKDFGATSVFGGAGYQLNPGDGNRDFWISGAAISHTVRPGFSIGGEVFRHAADAPDDTASTTLSVGFTAALTAHWALLASSQGSAGGYLALLASF